MRNLHEVARQRKLKELESFKNQQKSEKVLTESQSLRLSVNSLQQLLEQPDTSQQVIIDNISSIRASSENGQSESQKSSRISERMKPQLPKFAFQKKNYREAAKLEIQYLKQRRKQLDSGIQMTDFATKYQVDRLWEQVQASNKLAKNEATTILRQSAARQFMSILQKNILTNALRTIVLAAHIDRLSATISQRLLRRCFDGWWFEFEQRKQKSRMLLIMKKRIKQDDKLRKAMQNI